MKITRFTTDGFKASGACGPGLNEFTKLFGDGMDVTLDNLKKGIGLQWAWVADEHLSSTRKNIFLRALIRQKKAYDDGREPHLEHCRKNFGAASAKGLAIMQILDQELKYHTVNALYEACQADLEE